MIAQAVLIESQNQYDQVIEILKEKGFKAFQLGEQYRRCFLTIGDRYMQLSCDSKMLIDRGYETISFEEFIGGQNHVS